VYIICNSREVYRLQTTDFKDRPKLNVELVTRFSGCSSGHSTNTAVAAVKLSV